jgi:alkylation response protein AidB-like acyl-CoA dehydrogenase
MDLTLTADQEAVISSVANFLADRMPISRVREGFAQPSSIDREFWKQLAALGWFGFGLPEKVGGAGYALADEALLFREVGQRLIPGPLIATTIAAQLAAAAGAESLLASILDGSVVAGLAVPRHSLTDTTTRRVTLLDAAGADFVLVATPETAALYPLDAFTDVTPAESIDDATRVSTAVLSAAVPAVEVTEGAADLWRRAVVLTAAVLAGISAGARDMAVLHAKTREQFGAPIGVHQAIKHRCADMAVRIEAAETLLTVAALCIDEGRADADFHASAARIIAADAALTGSRDNIQIHGGMGFTFESDAHLYVKRTHVVDLTFGSATDHAATLINADAAL